MNIKEAWIRECQLNKGGAQTRLKGNERETSVKCRMAFKNQTIPKYGPFDHRIRREGEEVMRGREAGSVGNTRTLECVFLAALSCLSLILMLR